MKKHKLVLPSQISESPLSFYDSELIDEARSRLTSGKQVHFREYTPLKVQMENNNADVAEVVRCKDCEHGQFMPSCSMYLCRCTGGKLRYADDYCNYGERKETNEKHS